MTKYIGKIGIPAGTTRTVGYVVGCACGETYSPVASMIAAITIYKSHICAETYSEVYERLASYGEVAA